MASGPIPIDAFRFNVVCIVDSVPHGEADTAGHLHDYIGSQLEEHRLLAAIRRDKVESADVFRQYITWLTELAESNGLLPILHIEAHGSAQLGIYFADDSRMSWQKLCEVLAPLNRASNFCLLVVLATCYGADLISGLSLSRPAPWYSMIGPTNEIDPGEVMRSYRAFYRTAFATRDMVSAGQAVAQHPLEFGDFTVLSATYWFHLLMSTYLTDEVTPTYVRDFALRRHRVLKAEGLPSKMGEHKRLYRKNVPLITRRYFETFFMLDLPDNARRFGHIWDELQPMLTAAVRRL